MCAAHPATPLPRIQNGSGFTSRQSRGSFGTSSLRAPGACRPSSIVKNVTSVTLPPGRARLATRPSRPDLHRSRIRWESGGRRLGGERAASPPPATITAGRCARIRQPSRQSIVLAFGPAIFDRNVAAVDVARLGAGPGESRASWLHMVQCEALLRYPITGIAGCCARAASGHAAAAPPSSVMNSRRLVCRERSIVRGDGGWVITRPPSRREARSRLGS